MNRYREAIAAWKQETLLKPTDGSVLGEIADAYISLNDPKDAEDFLLRAVEAKKAAGHMTKADAAEVAVYWNQLALIYDKERKHKQADYYRSAAQYLLSQY
jgi:tetratricopeptide (TPR) repeat protein